MSGCVCQVTKCVRISCERVGNGCERVCVCESVFVCVCRACVRLGKKMERAKQKFRRHFCMTQRRTLRLISLVTSLWDMLFTDSRFCT